MEAARPATEEDVAVLATLARRALEELVPTRGGALFVVREGRAEPMEETLATDLGDDDATVVVGTIDGTPVGYGVGRLDPLRDGRRLGVITDLYVEAGARSVGVGEVMVQHLLEWFSGRGCIGADATALPGNRATKNFFEESGFTARLLVMHRSLAGER
ncbi:MAG: GNAT family N-acetyltransferase [Actinobacteria bacterium]|nr:GNAT family N-acetyltransferase [Actinomycetota bacterium]MBW3650483.1 GNAT family N-acetyltransferase [Actinomycetota bacterium]